MSILTRIFVVLNMFLAVALTAMVVPFVINSDTYKQKYHDELKTRILAQREATKAQDDISQTIAAYTRTIDNQKSQINLLTANNQTQITKLNALEADLIQSRNANADVRGKLARLSTAMEQQAKVNGMLQAEVKDRRERSLDLSGKLIDVSDKLRSEMTKVEVLELQVRRGKEVEAERDSEIANLSEQLEKVSINQPKNQDPAEMAAAPYESRTPIRGIITDVQKVDTEVYVAINLGKNDSVRAGMKFMVHDGEKYLGDIVVTKVDQDESAGRVVLIRGEITTNHQVLAGGRTN